MLNLLKTKNVKFGLLLIIIGVLLCIFGVISNHKKDKIEQIEEAIEHVFFYLPKSEYDDLNEMSDYCKISLVYGTDYLKNDVYLSKDDYDTIVNSKKNSVKGYKLSNVLKSVKAILGDNATINFDVNEYEQYQFLLQDNCKFGNNSLETLSYNQFSKYIYSIDDEEKNNDIKLYVKWEKPEFNENEVILTAYALLSIKNSEGHYDIYLDGNLSYKLDVIDGNVSYKIGKLYDKSNKYIFTLKKENDKYIWSSYKVINAIDDTVIYD